MLTNSFRVRKLEKLVTIQINIPEGWHPTIVKCSVDNEEYGKHLAKVCVSEAVHLPRPLVGHGTEYTLIINPNSLSRSEQVISWL
jgi:hypothetical protein